MENQIIGPILPLRDLVVYPLITSPLFVGRAKSIDAINFAMNNNNKIIYLFTQKNTQKNLTNKSSKGLFV
jgi:ATP-dependent Lon protease